ncbi:phosphatase PAP2 family protein [Sporocytophaga myxococcoides]|uniref:phosphatase PAP2 family protein n=1 Tax=Sporocytophaga myxococcoides TaxID=153721 RepID=UPI000400FEA1|nr:phosphatase PAP2 family protein [Sporocytophaga myxococcoides]
MIQKVYKKTIAIITLFSIEFLITGILFFASIFLFGVIVKELFYDKQDQFDHFVYQWVHQFTSPILTKFMKAMSFLASREFIPVMFVLLLLYFLFIKKHHWYSLKVPVVVIGSLLLNLFLKFLFNRPRPLVERLSEASGLSFPSGHSMTAFSFYGLLIYFTWKEVPQKGLRWIITIILLLIIHLIGLSRVYLGVHYASDVLAGFAIGYIWLILSILVLQRLEKYYQKKVDPLKQFE